MQSSEIGMSANPGNAFHPNTWEPEAEGSQQIVGPPYLLIKFQAVSKTRTKQIKQNRERIQVTKGDF